MKVVINKCYGGYGLSEKACDLFLSKKGKQFTKAPHKYASLMSVPSYTVDGEYWSDDDIPRHDPDLIAVVEELGKEADGQYARLQIIEIPDGTDYVIEKYDGREWVAESHETWS